MPRYFFNIRDGKSIPDKEGTELPDHAAARREAIRVAGTILDENAHLIDLGEDWAMEVSDERGLILFRLDFHVTASPAAQSPRQWD